MEIVAVFAPLLGAFIAGFLGKVVGDRGAQVITCLLMLVAALCGALLFREVIASGQAHVVDIFTWISSGDFDVKWSLRFDQLSLVMVVVVNFVSAAVHVYSVGYMDHDACRARFMSYLSLFTFAMLMLVTSNNFLQLFFGWEGVGLASYLLIGFWNEKDSANAAAVKAFVVNRVGDFGLALGIMAVFFVFGTLDYDTVFATVGDMKDKTMVFMNHDVHALSLIAALLFIGAMGKSAQLGLHTWLPDAMEGPTPVSALIHAATMVTAGVFLVVRMSPIYEYTPEVMQFITVVGALTALIAATIGITQFDIKRVIAYSTMSQLGYMFFALGVSAYGAAMFHLFTHAFFKALLFLGSGSVIHAMSGEQDMRKMGGIWKHIPVTYALMWIGSLALAGVPFFSGYYSKDLILESDFAVHTHVGNFAFACGIVAAFLTAFYSWRLIFMTFHGAAKADEKVMAHIHESPRIMLYPLYFLAAGAIGAGIWGKEMFVGELREKFWGESIRVFAEHDAIEAAHHVELWVKWLPVVVATLGILLAYRLYMSRPDIPARIVTRFRWIHALLFNKWYFDEIYDRLIVRPVLEIGRDFWKLGDGKIIDGFGPDGVAHVVQDGASRARELQSGYVYHYAFAMLLGVVLFISWYLLKAQG